MLPIDRFAWTNRWSSHHPGERMLLAGGLLILTLVLPPVSTAPLVLITMTAATVLGAGVPVSAFIRALAVPAGFLLAGLPFIVLSLDLDGAPSLVVSAEGARMALEVGLRSLAAMSCLVGLSLTTPASELIPWLRRVGVPQAVLEIALLMYRLLFVVAARATAGREAQEARLGYTSFGRSVRSLGLLTAALLSRSLARARRLEIGLAARGFEGELRVLSRPRALSPRRLATAGATLLAVGVGGLSLSQVLA
ncbi:cobalt ECF transporter T component CbiQ [Thiocapsa marina]|uniref:Cobalt ABC transporter, inner membrane subunit CbiQ n=1 Tax=Thiocapsa marina 5811 TaxID=768671 RepID=F9UA55_9GAMM|nr:cobalt ECF transporter T component CbiQ [Thiocapsa marina]EGV19003.1 cobalt ABC transporter, inner membrane subunit CbiQ [Thiocapsa marina 5811]